MLSSLKKWVQDVAVDLAPPLSSSPIPGSTHHYFYSMTPCPEQQESRTSSSSAVYLSRPISLESMGSSRRNTISIPPPLASPVEVDLSHLNREEQEHIANVLRRARAVEEQQQQSTLPSVTLPSRLSPSASISSSSSASTSSCSSEEQPEKYDNKLPIEGEKSFPSTRQSILTTSIHQCQTYEGEHEENSPDCFPCHEKESLDRQEIEEKNTFLNQQLISINKSLSVEKDEIYENVNLSRANHLTEIDENAFFYEEISPYEVVRTSNTKDERLIPSYQIDELIDDDDQDERDHVKELEETIANLTRHFPSEDLLVDSSSNVLHQKIDTDSILEMQIESPVADELFISVPSYRTSLSRSSGVKQNLTDLLVPATLRSNPPLQRTLSTYSKRMLSINRHKRNLPSVPDLPLPHRLQLRRANSESRFSLPAVPPPAFISSHNLDDESDLLEIDLNDPTGSITRRLRSKTDSEFQMRSDNPQSSIKQSRDQMTNTPPLSTFDSSFKSKKKSSSPTNYPISPSPIKLQKSTSTEITYPFPVTKLILNPSQHDLGFRITGGHSNSNCMEVTACIEHIDRNHRNYRILENIVQEGDEVLELAGVSLRGKSALFVKNLMNTVQNEFEITVRNQLSHSFLPTETNIQRRHSVNPASSQMQNNLVTKSRSTGVCSFDQGDAIMNEEESSPKTKALTSNEETSTVFSHRQRASLLPNDPGINAPKNNIGIERQNSNESDESDSLSQYFHNSQSRKDSLTTTSDSQRRTQSMIPMANCPISASSRLQNFLRSDPKRPSRGSTNIERKSSLSFAAKFLRKKTKSVDYSHRENTISNQLRESDYVGDIELQIGHDSEREQLVVRIIQAKNLLPKDTNGFSDPFVKVYLLPGRDQENKRRIKNLWKTLNPLWNQTVIYGHMHGEEVQYKKLEITVWDYDRFKANDFLGQVTIDLKNPNVINDKPQWYRLQALRSREEITNRGSSPRLFKRTSTDSAASLGVNKNAVHIQERTSQEK